MLKRLKVVTAQKWISSLPRDRAAQIIKEKEQEKKKKPRKKKTVATNKRLLRMKGPSPPPSVVVNGKNRRLELNLVVDSPPSPLTCLPIAGIDQNDCIVEEDEDEKKEEEKEKSFSFECLVCASYRGWWCRACDHYYIKHQLQEVEWMTHEQISRLFNIVQDGQHPELVPCFICNRTGQKNLDITIKGHEDAFKYDNFWQTVLFFLLM